MDWVVNRYCELRHEIREPAPFVSRCDVELGVARIDDLPGSLDVHAECLQGGDTNWQYAFRIEHAGHQIASGHAAVMVAQERR